MEGIIVTTHLRNAAGVCALSIGLLVCNSGGAIAFADQADAGGAATGSPGVTANGDDTTTTASTSTGPTSTVGNQLTDDDSVGGTTTSPGTGSSSTVSATGTTTSLGTGPTTIGPANGPTSTFQAQTNTSTKPKDDPDLGIAKLDLDEIELGLTPDVVAKKPLVQTFSPAPLAYKPHSGSSSAPVAPTPGGHEGFFGPFGGNSGTTFASGQDQLKPDSITKAVVVPVSNAGALLVQALGQAGFTLVNLPSSDTPIADVIASLAVVVGGVVGAVVEVAKVPGNLVALFGVSPGGVQPPLIGGGAAASTMRIPLDVPLRGHEVSQPPLALSTAEAPLFGSVIRAANPAGILTSSSKNDMTLSGLAPAPSGVNSATTSFLDNVVTSVLVPASLTALAAIAVPGLGGLLIVCAAGIRVGYRQAKAGLALRASGIARFAGPGPMGVVRSGSLIALHSRTSRIGKTYATPVTRAKSAAGPRLLESVA